MGSIAVHEAPRHPVTSIAEMDDDTIVEIADACNIPTGIIEDLYTCLPLQQSMIAENRAEVFHFIISFGPTADIDRFCECLRKVVATNSILRTRLVRSASLGGIVQVVTSEEHVTEHHPGVDGEDVERYLQQDPHRMGLCMPLFRTAFIGRFLVLTQHHAVFDYWSWDAMMNVDIAGAYLQSPKSRIKVSPRPPFKDFVSRCLNVDETEARGFWASRFKGSPAIFLKPESPRTSPRVVSKPTRKFHVERIKTGVLPPTHAPHFLEAAWALTASIYTDSESVAYGYVLSGRTPTPDGLENTLGPTVTEIPMQTNLQRRTMTVDKLIKDRAASIRQLHQNPHLMHYPLEKIAALSGAAKSACAFSALFNVRPAVFANAAEEGEIKMERMVWLNGLFPLQLIFSITGEGIEVWPRVDATVVDDRQLDRLLNQFSHTFRLLTEASPQTKLDNLPLLDPQGREEVFQLNKTIPEPVQATLYELFTAQARAQPKAMAVTTAGDGNLTYAQLDWLSSRLGCVLQLKGVGTASRVGLLIDRSPWAIVAILAVLKVGGVCVPIDNRNSGERNMDLLLETGARLILTLSAQYARAIVGRGIEIFVMTPESITEIPPSLEQRQVVTNTSQPEDPAYVFHASYNNTPGTRKAVLLEHRSLASALTCHAQRFRWGPATRMLQFWSLASENSALEVFGALLSGGCLCIPPLALENSGESTGSWLSRFIKSAKVDFAMLPPSVIRELSPASVPTLRSLVSVGEPLQQADTETYKTWARSFQLFNRWGATAAPTLSIVSKISPDVHHGFSSNNVGMPVGCAAWIVNPSNVNDLAPFGGVGELVIEGPGTASASFGNGSILPRPQWALDLKRGQATRFFRTGDLSKYNSDGSISFVGRISNRVKLSGCQMVQLEDLERTIVGCSQVRECVTAAKIIAGRTQIVALVCLADPRLPRGVSLQRLIGPDADIAARGIDVVHAYTQSRLPADRVPASWIAVERLPRTLSHKIDRVAVKEWLKTLKR
ncbi:uncharacterized protein B0H64DRAFT_410777 [Chaetomium fimeti]|uniref:Uncharacterized protein n=1 Tax=Chaetomium fimeti TaxID=1854472 RepID=A0AAE0LMH5_9PEZI|nr:hypothetical protein B0H64DRAFT_410777 [Chaetomium fimeti]